MSRPMYRHPGPAAAQLPVTVPQEGEPTHEVDVARWLSQMRADMAETLGGIMLRGTRPVKIGIAGGQPVGTYQPAGMPGRLTGWSLRETSGTGTGTVRFYDGRGDETQGGHLIATVTIPAGGSSNVQLAGNGVSYIDGLYCDLSMTTGGVEGAVHLGAAD